MSRKKNRQRRQQPEQTAAVGGVSAPASFISGYAAANWSDKRGRMFWPTLDTSRELDQFSRQEIVTKIRALAGNEGLVKGFIEGVISLLGTLTPRPMTDDPEWNREVMQRFKDRCGTPAAFDVGGKFDFWSAQEMMIRMSFRDGDALTVFTETNTRAAQFAFYDACQVRNPDGESEGWYDGVFCDENTGRHLYYGVGKSGKAVKIAARDAHYWGCFESAGNVRVTPPLTHTVNHAQDRMEIRSDVKLAVKNSALSALMIERDAGTPLDAKKHGLPGTAMARRMDVGGATVEEQWTMVTQGGQRNELNPGEKAKILNDSRPHPNQMDFMDSLVRDMAFGYGLSPQLVYFISELTASSMRAVLDLAERWILRKRQVPEEWCRRVWVYFVAKEIKYKGLRMPKGEQWWRVSFSAQRSLTIDRSREMKTRLDARDVGTCSDAMIAEEFYGRSNEEIYLERCQEERRKLDLCAEYKLDYAQVFPPRSGSIQAAGNGQDQGGNSNQKGQ